MTKFIILILFSCLVTSSCNRILCGDLPKELKQLHDSANLMYSEHLRVENIPCESFYTRVIFNENVIDTMVIQSIHKILYDEESGIGWPVLLIYDPKGQYIFSHNYENNIYIQTGD